MSPRCEPLRLDEDASGDSLGGDVRWDWDGDSLRVQFASLEDDGTRVERDLGYGLEFFDGDGEYGNFVLTKGRPSELPEPWPKMVSHLPDIEMQFGYHYWGSEHPERRFHCGYEPSQGRPCDDNPCEQLGETTPR